MQPCTVLSYCLQVKLASTVSYAESAANRGADVHDGDERMVEKSRLGFAILSCERIIN